MLIVGRKYNHEIKFLLFIRVKYELISDTATVFHSVMSFYIFQAIQSHQGMILFFKLEFRACSF